MIESIEPVKKIDFKSLGMGDSISIHVDRLATFKSTVSRYNGKMNIDAKRFAFDYTGAVDNYVTATRKKYVKRKPNPTQLEKN